MTGVGSPCARARCSPRSSPSTAVAGRRHRDHRRGLHPRPAERRSTTPEGCCCSRWPCSAPCSSTRCCSATARADGAARADDGRVDLAPPGMRAHAARGPPGGPEAQRRLQPHARPPRGGAPRGGRAVLRAQEQERSRIAQDLHDEVNQALTGDPAAARRRREGRAARRCAPSCRRPSGSPTRRWRSCSTLARQLRPTALDDHGLIPALASQVEDFSQRTGIARDFPRHGEVPRAVRRGAARHLPRHAGEPVQHRPARARQARDVRAVVRRPHDAARSPTTATASTPAVSRATAAARTPGGLGLSGMRERALLVGRQPRHLLRARRGDHDRTDHGSAS